ncbi:MAG: hypothetical protein HQ478_03050 [Chloroflexi bacterium]|nr:hypothetical protein [Chloroflexota bacterium]
MTGSDESLVPINSEVRGVLWPNCAYIGGLECVSHAFSRHLGQDISAKISEFAGNAEPGARLTLQKGKDGFTLQVTSEVIRDGGVDDIRLTRLAEMSHSMNGVSAEVRSNWGHEAGLGDSPTTNGRSESPE